MITLKKESVKRFSKLVKLGMRLRQKDIDYSEFQQVWDYIHNYKSLSEQLNQFFNNIIREHNNKNDEKRRDKYLQNNRYYAKGKKFLCKMCHKPTIQNPNKLFCYKCYNELKKFKKGG